MSELLPLLSNSSLTTFRRCPREYYARYVLMRKPRRKAKALRDGSFMHVGLNAWWREPGDAASKLAAALLAIGVRAATNREDADQFDLAKAEALLTGYTVRWGDAPYETIAVEKMFRLPHVQTCGTCEGNGTFDGDACEVCDGDGDELSGYDLGGAIDAIVYQKSGPYRTTIHNVEHKTTSSDISPGSDYWRHVVALDSQVSTYEAASKSLGYDVRDTIYDVIRKPEIEPLKATPEDKKKYTKPTKSEPIPRLYSAQRETDETPEEYGARLRDDITKRPDWYFQRMTIVRLDRDHVEHARDVWQTAQMIRFAETNDAWPRSPNACERYHRLCEYHDVCSGLTTIEDNTQFTTKAKQHEELEIEQ